MKNFFFLFLVSVFINTAQSQVMFLGFEQEQCATELNYSIYNFNCGAHTWGYRILRGDNIVYERDCPGPIGEGYGASQLRFINDSTGFLIEYVSLDGGGGALTTIRKTTDYGYTWSFFTSTFFQFGPPRFIAYYVLNKDEIVCIAAPECYQPKIGYVIIDDVVDSVDNDTTLYFNKTYSSDCGIDTLDFKVKWSGDTVSYEIVLNFENTSTSTLNQNDLRVYPNPVGDILYFELKDKNRVVKRIDIYNYLGQKVRTIEDLMSNQINIKDLKSGFYFIKITIKNTETTIKIMKI